MKRMSMKMKYKSKLYGSAFALISISGFVFFYMYPFIISINKTFSTRTNQYTSLFSSEAFRLALKNTLEFVGIGIPVLYVLSLLTALAMNRLYSWKVKGRGIILALHVLPMLIPSAVVAFFIQVFFERYGVVNGVLEKLDLSTVDWLYSSKAFLVLMMIYLWKNYGYCMIIMMGGIQSIPSETIEAAKLEGAGKLTILRKIILPQIKTYSIFTCMMGIIGIFKVFRESYMMFGNYPDKSIYMLQNFMNNCFYSLNYNRLATASTIMIGIFSVLVLIMLYQDNEWRRKV